MSTDERSLPEIARKKRHLALVQKLSTGGTLSKPEIDELEDFEADQKGQKKVEEPKHYPVKFRLKRNEKYDWNRIYDEWMDCRLTLKDFAKKKGIAYATIRDKTSNGVKIFQVRKRRQNAFESAAAVTEIGRKLNKVQGGEEKQAYVIALNKSAILLEHIMTRAAESFELLSGHRKSYNSAGEAGRLAIQASDTLRQISLEVQGIPAIGEEFGWPLTKGFWPFPYQRDFIFDTPSTLRAQGEDVFIFGFIGGIGSGKTRAGAEKFGDLCWRNRGTTGAIFGPTYRMLEDSTKLMFFKVLAEKGMSYKYRASDNSITLFGDTKILFRSVDDPDHLRGAEFGHFWFDEPGQLAEAMAFNVIMGRMRDARAPEPCGLITTTPSGLNWLYDALVTKGKENRVKLYHGTSLQNVALSEGYVDRLGALYDERFYAQEVLGKWIDVFAGQAYWNFDHTESISAEFDYAPAHPIALCVDFNVDPMCWNIVQQWRYRDGRIVEACVDEIHVRTASTEIACKEFIERYGKHQAGITVYGDATGHSRTTAATRTDYQIIQEMLEKAELPAVEIKVGRYNPGVTDSIASVNARLKNANGERSFFVHPRCTQTVRDFERVAFVSGTRQLDKSQKDLTHHSDAIRYHLYSQYPVRKPTVSIGKAA